MAKTDQLSPTFNGRDASANPPDDSAYCSIAEMVSAQVALNPRAAAVVTDTGLMTYEELEGRANQLANYLVKLGVQAETIVAIALDRSVESVVSALAVLKSGGAFLPVDPKQPCERLKYLLADARPAIMITKGALQGLELDSIRAINLDEDEEIQSQPDTPPAITATPEQLAYVIYTSGSTGQPKGVEITIGNLLNLINWHRTEFRITSADRASHLAGVAFDAAVWEVWPYLTAGATLYLPDESTRLSPIALRDWIVRNEITVSFLPTVLAEELIDMDWPRIAALRFLLTGADTLHRYPTRHLPFQLVNNYGPTECTVVATSGRVLPQRTSALPAIGRPITNTQIYVLDENLSEVPAGETGELYIGGANVGRGYLNQPELTANRFVSDPFNAEPGRRLYRTGDLGRRLPTGEIAYAGRIDEQIKILGYRIEPAEIEAVIDRHPAIASSVVVARGHDCSGKRLIGYVTARNGSLPTAIELRDFLSASLPDYMIPGIIVGLDQLPLTANGKLDRSSLPEPSNENRLREEAFAAPRTPTEERVAEIIGSLFNVKEVGVNDNFFLLGGHSLLGAQLVIKIRNAFAVELPLRAIFDAPTIAALSQTIEQHIIARVAAMTEAEAQALVA